MTFLWRWISSKGRYRILGLFWPCSKFQLEDLFGVKIKMLDRQFFSTEKNFGILIRMSFGGCFWALGFCVDRRNKTCFGKMATTSKVKIGPRWSKIKKLDKKMFLWTKKSFSPKTCVHWIKVVGQKPPNIRYGPLWMSFILSLFEGLISKFQMKTWLT